MSERDDERSRSDRPQYHHDATKGETRYPPQSGKERSGEPGEADVHHRLNTPVSEIEEAAEVDRLAQGGRHVDVQGMGRAQRGDPGGGPGDPVVRGGGDPEVRNAAQSTPAGEVDAEAAAVREVEESTGVSLTGNDPADVPPV